MKYVLFLLSICSFVYAGSPQGFPALTTTVVGTGVSTALAANKDRGYLIIQNNGSGNCWMKFGTTMSGVEGLVIGSGQNYEPSQSFIKSALFMRCTVAGSSIVMVEANW